MGEETQLASLTQPDFCISNYLSCTLYIIFMIVQSLQWFAVSSADTLDFNSI